MNRDLLCDIIEGFLPESYNIVLDKENLEISNYIINSKIMEGKDPEYSMKLSIINNKIIIGKQVKIDLYQENSIKLLEDFIRTVIIPGFKFLSRISNSKVIIVERQFYEQYLYPWENKIIQESI